MLKHAVCDVDMIDMKICLISSVCICSVESSQDKEERKSPNLVTGSAVPRLVTALPGSTLPTCLCNT